LEAAGFDLVLFTGAGTRASALRGIEVVRQPTLQRGSILAPVVVASILAKAALRCPVRAWRFMVAERRHGAGWLRALERLVMNVHVLSYGRRLDWLHFEFATMALGREGLAAITGSRMAVSLRGYDIAVYPLKHSGCYTRLWSAVDKVHVLSDDLARKAEIQGLKPGAPCVKIRPAIDTTLFRGPSEIPALDRPPTLLTVGRLHWKKGHEYVLDALAQLHAEGIPFFYRIVGSGPERERLVFAAHQLGLSGQVAFTGPLAHADVIEELRKADIYIQYSVQEGFCNAVLEAQAMGLLTVVSDAEGLSENVLDGVTGWVVPRRRPEQLAAAVREILEADESHRKRIRRNAMKRTREEFSYGGQTALFERFYREGPEQPASPSSPSSP